MCNEATIARAAQNLILIISAPVSLLDAGGEETPEREDCSRGIGGVSSKSVSVRKRNRDRT